MKAVDRVAAIGEAAKMEAEVAKALAAAEATSSVTIETFESERTRSRRSEECRAGARAPRRGVSHSLVSIELSDPRSGSLYGDWCISSDRTRQQLTSPYPTAVVEACRFPGALHVRNSCVIAYISCCVCVPAVRGERGLAVEHAQGGTQLSCATAAVASL